MGWAHRLGPHNVLALLGGGIMSSLKMQTQHFLASFVFRSTEIDTQVRLLMASIYSRLNQEHNASII